MWADFWLRPQKWKYWILKTACSLKSNAKWDLGFLITAILLYQIQQQKLKNDLGPPLCLLKSPSTLLAWSSPGLMTSYLNFDTPAILSNMLQDVGVEWKHRLWRDILLCDVIMTGDNVMISDLQLVIARWTREYMILRFLGSLYISYRENCLGIKSK